MTPEERRAVELVRMLGTGNCDAILDAAQEACSGPEQLVSVVLRCRGMVRDVTVTVSRRVRQRAG